MLHEKELTVYPDRVNDQWILSTVDFDETIATFTNKKDAEFIKRLLGKVPDMLDILRTLQEDNDPKRYEVNILKDFLESGY